MDNNIVQPLDDNDVNTGKNYLINKLTMNPDGTIDEARFGLGIFYTAENGKLYQASNIDEGFTIKKMPNNLSSPKFTRSSVSQSVSLTFLEGIQATSFWIVLLIRDNFDSQIRPIYRKPFSASLYESGGTFKIDRINYNLNFGDASEYFVFN